MRRFALIAGALLAIASVPLGVPGFQAEAEAEARSFGTHCQNDFQDPRLGNLFAFEVCSRFNTRLAQGATHKFYYDLVGKQYFWHDTGDQETNSLEDVDLFFTMTHGGYNNDLAAYSMWETGVDAETSQMRLGDEGVGTSILAGAVCKTLHFDDYTWNRWDSVFKGGLRMAAGSYDMFWWKREDNQVGSRFGTFLNVGHTFKYAWSAAFNQTVQPEDPAIMVATGPGVDCDYRRDQMTWDNYESFERLRDDQADNWCGWYWIDL